MSPRVLIVDDDPSMCGLLRASLSRRGFLVRTEGSADEALIALGAEDFDVLVTDLNLRGMSGIELCERAAGTRPEMPAIVITAFGSMDTAIAAIRAGAYDFLTKPFEMDELVLVLERALQHKALREEVKRLRRQVEEVRRIDELIGTSGAMQKVYDLLERVADSDVSVLITGETGTGKEVVARALHRRSRRREGPFVALNCAAVPETLLESELFGHVRGAFTDARFERPGMFLQADRGTLFLDEIGDMPLSMQAKLLRVLQERTVRPVGGAREVPFDVRLLSATNRDLESAVEEGRFREDLFFRIHVVRIDLPPLRSRGNDILVLAQHFVQQFARSSDKEVRGLSSAVAEKLLGYAWPGNVRELQNCVERAVALTRYEQLVVEDLPEKIRNYRSTQLVLGGDDPSELPPMEEVERRYVLRVLEAVGGNKTLAAQILGFDRKTLYRKLERYDALHESPKHGTAFASTTEA
jgi:DNA-binding NtrC family response regulator